MRRLVWSLERDLIITRGYENDTPTREVIAELNRTAGRKITIDALHAHAAILGIKRSPTFRGRCVAKWRGQRKRIKSAERLAILRVDWPLGVEPEVIAAKMDALPGHPVVPARLGVWAKEIGVKRPTWYIRLTQQRKAFIKARKQKEAKLDVPPAAPIRVVAPVPFGGVRAVTLAPRPFSMLGGRMR